MSACRFSHVRKYMQMETVINYIVCGAVHRDTRVKLEITRLEAYISN